MQIFEQVLFFKLRTTANQKNKQLIQLIFSQLDVGCWWREKGHETHLFFSSASLPHLTDKRSVELTVCFFCFRVVSNLKKKDLLENVHVLSCFWQSTPFHFFFFFLTSRSFSVVCLSHRAELYICSSVV